MTYQEWKNAHAFRLPASAMETLDRIMVGQPDQIAAAVLREREFCAAICDDESKRILSKQSGREGDPSDLQLRIIACVLPDVAAAIRNRGTK